MNKNSGFSLLETMIALLVLGISLLGLAQLFGLAVYQNGYSRHSTMAVSVARSKLEELRNTYNAELETGTPSADLTAGSHGPETKLLDAPTASSQGDWRFLITWNVTDASGGQKTVVVTATPEAHNEKQTKIVSITCQFAP